jgi:hypothetical protein
MNQNLLIPDKKVDNSVAKVEAPSRVPSKRARKPRKQTPTLFALRVKSVSSPIKIKQQMKT